METLNYTRITARATGVNVGNGHYISKAPVFSSKDKSCHGVCGSMNNPDWRQRNNAKPITVHNRHSDSFCL